MHKTVRIIRRNEIKTLIELAIYYQQEFLFFIENCINELFHKRKDFDSLESNEPYLLFFGTLKILFGIFFPIQDFRFVKLSAQVIAFNCEILFFSIWTSLVS